MSKYQNNQLEAYYTEEGRINYAQSSRHEYNLKDHLGNTRVCFTPNPANPTNIQPKILQQTNYYAYGLPIGNLSRTYPLSGTMALEQKYQYNQKELNNDFGLLWSDYGARWLDLQRGVWGQIDPLAEKYYGWSGYNYVMGNPIRLIDPTGMFGVYHNQAGKFLGDDGIDDGALYVVTDKAEEKSIKTLTKNKQKVNSSDVKSKVKTPSAFVRNKMHDAVKRAGSPSFHEEGGIFGTSNGQEVVIEAKPGQKVVPSIAKKATMNVFQAADPSTIPGDLTIEGTYHTHPDGTVVTGGDDANTIGESIKTDFFENPPSNKDGKGDIPNAQANVMGVTGNSYVLAQGNKTVYIYNGSGVVATFPFEQFFSIGIK